MNKESIRDIAAKTDETLGELIQAAAVLDSVVTECFTKITEQDSLEAKYLIWRHSHISTLLVLTEQILDRTKTQLDEITDSLHLIVRNETWPDSQIELRNRLDDAERKSGTSIFKLARTAAGVTQEQVAKTLGVAQTAVSSWETGAALPRGALLVKVSDLYGCSIDDLLRGNGENDG
jgi:DNA-binding XRE family transcriptional regulator